jgi:putative DNA primase/helicase
MKHIPNALRERDQWIVWQEERRDDKTTKVPYTITGQHAKSNDPRTWSSFDAALKAARTNGYNGVGFAFTDSDGLVGIDLDHCISASGSLLPWAAAIVKEINSYTEYSPSGEGLHIILEGTLPEGGRRKGNVEMYDQLRYFTMTGDLLDDGHTDIQERQDELKALHARIFSKPERKPAPAPAQTSGAALDDGEILQRAMSAKNGAKFARLFAGDHAGYQSQSEADLALCMMLAFWSAGDSSQMDRLFRRSGLYRPKWDNRHYADGRSYGQGTIEKALQRQQEYYEPPTDSDVVTEGELISPEGEGDVSPREEKQIPEPCISIDLPPPIVAKGLKKSETGDAELLATMYRDRIAYDHAEGEWYLWNGNHWELDRTGKIGNLVAYQVAGQYLSAAAELRKTGAADLAGSMAQRAGALRRRNRISNTLNRAESQPNIALTGDEWDSNPWTLGVANGVVDLRTGDHTEGNPKDYIRKASPTPWEGLDAEAPRWEQFLIEIFEGDLETIEFVQRLLGYGITGLAVEHVLPVLWGDGRNGKGTLLETIGAVLGNDLASPTESNTLMTASRGGGGGPQPFLYALRGTRLVWASETNEGQVMNLGLVKRLTGGDTITCRTLHSKPVTFTPSYLIMLITNNKPHVTAEDPAIWDRLRLIPFTQRFVDNPKADNEHPKDKYLSRKLKEEAPGILAWLVRGCLAWQRAGGLHAPDSVMGATEDYRREEDILGRFLTECTIEKPGARTRAMDLYDAYKVWCEANGITPRSNTTFGKKIKRFYLDDARDMHGRYYKDIGLLTDDPIEF